MANDWAFQYTNGSYLSSGAAGNYVLPAATTTVLGGVKAGSGVTISGTGVLSVPAGTYTLPTASATVLGGVKQGTNVTIDGSGFLSATFTVPIATGSVLGGVKSGANVSIDGAGVISVAAPYSLPTAAAGTLGGVKVGANLSIDGAGVLSASAGGYSLPTATATVLGGVKQGANVSIDGAGILSVATPFSLQVASTTVLGGVKQGANTAIDGAGVISVAAPYTLPIAASGVLGGVRQGSNVTIDGAGIISVAAPYSLPIATGSTLGGIKAGSGLAIDGTGLLTATGATGYSNIVDVQSAYSGFFDGNSHLVSATYGTLSAAQTAFPNAGITSGTYPTDQLDCMILKQACYNLANGAGGTIWLRPGSGTRINRTIDIIDASKVTVLGGPHAAFFTEGCGATAAWRIGTPGLWNDRMGAVVMAGFHFYAFNSGGIADPVNPGGTASTAYRAGSIAISCDTIYDFTISDCMFNGFDTPQTFGNNVWLLNTLRCRFTDGNKGIHYGQMAPGTISGERMLWDQCTSANNNYGVYADLTDTANASTNVTMAVVDCSIDYNTVRQVWYKGTVTNNSFNNTLSIVGGHHETNSATSGTALARCYSNGIFLMERVAVYENGGSGTPGMIEIGTFGSATSTNCKYLAASGTPIFLQLSGVGGSQVAVQGACNVMRTVERAILLKSIDNGSVMQAPHQQPTHNWVNGDPGTPLSNQGIPTLLNGNGAYNVTINPDSTAFHPVYTELLYLANDTGTYTFTAGAGVTLQLSTGTVAAFTGLGKRAVLRKMGANNWLLKIV